MVEEDDLAPRLVAERADLGERANFDHFCRDTAGGGAWAASQRGDRERVTGSAATWQDFGSFLATNPVGHLHRLAADLRTVFAEPLHGPTDGGFGARRAG